MQVGVKVMRKGLKMDKCREEFEDWYKLTLISESKCSHKEREALFDYSFMVWKASRESMKAIKLPEATFETPSGDNALREDAVIEAITSAGYKVE